MLLLPGTATPPAALAPLAALLPRAVIGAHHVGTNRALLDDGVVFGWSSGAFTALSLAATEPAVTHLILFEPPYRADEDRAPGQGAIFLRLLAWEALRQRTTAAWSGGRGFRGEQSLGTKPQGAPRRPS
jgi:pimeloyl-ACP methyl ester carboxylesterase